MTTTAAQMLDTRAAILELMVTIDAPTARVWSALTEEANAWWVADLRCVPGDSEVSLDARAGGQLIEASADGGSLLWFNVVAIEPGQSLNLIGHVAPPFGGPNTSCLLLRLEAQGDRTLLHITNSMYGVVDETLLGQVEAGWRLLFENGLKRYAEDGTQLA